MVSTLITRTWRTRWLSQVATKQWLHWLKRESEGVEGGAGKGLTPGYFGACVCLCIGRAKQRQLGGEPLTRASSLEET